MRLALALSINVVLLALTFLILTDIYAGILVGLSLVAWFFYFLWKRQKLVENRVEEKIRGQNVIIPVEQALFRAQESSGYSQVTGMGYIVLTEDFLYFDLSLLDLIVCVPTQMLKGAEYVYRLKGVSPGKKMLRIMYTNEAGESDSIAINVKDMEKWKSEVYRFCV